MSKPDASKPPVYIKKYKSQRSSPMREFERGSGRGFKSAHKSNPSSEEKKYNDLAKRKQSQ